MSLIWKKWGFELKDICRTSNTELRISEKPTSWTRLWFWCTAGQEKMEWGWRKIKKTHRGMRVRYVKTLAKASSGMSLKAEHSGRVMMTLESSPRPPSVHGEEKKNNTLYVCLSEGIGFKKMVNKKKLTRQISHLLLYITSHLLHAHRDCHLCNATQILQKETTSITGWSMGCKAGIRRVFLEI